VDTGTAVATGFLLKNDLFTLPVLANFFLSDASAEVVFVDDDARDNEEEGVLGAEYESATGCDEAEVGVGEGWSESVRVSLCVGASYRC